jgi:hypothetical protein
LFIQDEQHRYERMAELLRDNNPNIDPRTKQFNSILFIMTRHLDRNNGRLIADDYNFYVDQFNIVNQLIQDIEKTSLPKNEKKKKIEEYIDRILGKGEIIDIQKEIKKLHNDGLSAN